MPTKAIYLYYIVPTSQCQIYFIRCQILPFLVGEAYIGVKRDGQDASRFSTEGCVLQQTELECKGVLVECDHIVGNCCSFC